MKMTVLGTGYLGVTHAACMAELGHEVLGVDIDAAKIDLLRRGEVPFFEPGLPDLVSKHVSNGALQFSTSYEEAADFADLHFVGVGTPQVKGELSADTSAVFSAVEKLVPLLRGDALIVGKSTVPVGTARKLQGLTKSLSSDDIEVEVVWNPEFLREGFGIEDTLRPDRIVVGSADKASRGGVALRGVYGPILREGCPVFDTDFETAELVKVTANAFLATKISFINAVSEVCDAAGADVKLLADAIGMDERIGRRFLNAGLGFGGGCLPKDIRAFMARAGELGADSILSFLREVDLINMRQREKVTNLVIELCGGTVVGKNVAVLGAAFKPNSDDVRDSPALNVAGVLSLRGAQVSVYDPEAMANARRAFPTLHYSSSVTGACQTADVIVVATEWPEFIDLDPELVAEVTRNNVIVDGRNCLDGASWRSAGWTYRGLGRG